MSEESTAGRGRKLGWLVLRATLTVGLLAWVVSRVPFADVSASFRKSNVPAVSLGLFLLSLSAVLSWVRWWGILRVLGIRVPFGRVLAWSWLGLFFNNFSLGTVGGDVAKAVLVARQSEARAGAVATVILDRMLGFVTMLFLAAGSAALNWDVPAFSNFRWFVVGGVGLLGVGWLLYSTRVIRNRGAFRWVRDRLPAQNALREMDRVFLGLREHRGWALAGLALSAVAQCAGFLGMYWLGHGLDAVWGAVHPLPFATVLPLLAVVAVVTAVPISLGGWGFGEVAFAYFLGIVGVPAPRAVALSVGIKLAYLAMSLPAAPLLLLGRRPIRGAAAGRGDESTRGRGETGVTS